MVKLRVRAGESIQEAVRRFRKLCERSGLRKEMRRKAYYEKPSERRRREELKRLRKARQSQTLSLTGADFRALIFDGRGSTVS